MKKMRNFIVLICTLVLLPSFCSGAHSINVVTELSRAEADQFVLDEIASIIERGSPLCVWNENTKWTTVVPLYDCYSECNGYVYILETDQQRTGYLQVNQLGDKLATYCYSYKGIPAYEGLNRGKEGLGESEDEKLYFFGNMSYCVKTVDGQFKAIDGVDSAPVEDAVEYYEDFVKTVMTQREEAAKAQEEANRAAKYNSTISNFSGNIINLMELADTGIVSNVSFNDVNFDDITGQLRDGKVLPYFCRTCQFFIFKIQWNMV